MNEFYLVTWLCIKKDAIFDRPVFAEDSVNISTMEELVVFKIAGFS